MLGNNSATGTIYQFLIDTTPPDISFTDNVETGPVNMDTITVDRDASAVTRWMYNENTGCSSSLDDYPYDGYSNPNLDQSDETHNGSYICIFAKDSYANTTILASAHPINVDITHPTAT